MTVEIQVNGDRQEVSQGSTIADLLKQLGMQPRFLAVERNCELVPRGRHQDCELQSGDRIEIVTLVGGG